MVKRLTKKERKALAMLPASTLRKLVLFTPDPYKAEHARSAASEDTLMKHTARNVRYSKGGLHERLKHAAKKKQSR